jgi:sec-independent protein translocase protein TatA
VLSSTEILIIVFVAALIFGAGRLPQIGDALGRSIRNFKKAVKGDNEIDVTPREQTKELPPSSGDEK